MLGSEAELAGVLAHEIAHVLRRHHITVMQKSAAISAGAQLAQRDNRSALLNNMIGAGAEVMARGLDKQAEFDADAAAVVIAARGGYSPYGIVEMLQKLAARGASDASLALLFKTHPPAGERLAQLGAALAPRVASLPAGKEPPIKTVAAGTRAVRAAQPTPAVPSAASAPEAQGAPALAPKGGGLGVDPAGILRGIFGR
jgi:predicted Zn-dependent protease